MIIVMVLAIIMIPRDMHYVSTMIKIGVMS